MITAGASGLRFSGNRITHVTLTTGDVIDADHVVLAMGPWSTEAAHWLAPTPAPQILFRIGCIKAHSVVLRPADPTTADALFTSYEDEDGNHSDPEVYPRPDGTVYICGSSETVPLPADASLVVPRAGACEKLITFAGHVSTKLLNASVVAKQACFLPTSPDGLPLVGRVPGMSGVCLATGHSCWGILNGPVTGLVIAEIIATGHCDAYGAEAVDPQRLVSDDE
eukprot:Colp12_sorted_trinity150504_noHs@17236